jgi:hypothetical protein
MQPKKQKHKIKVDQSPESSYVQDQEGHALHIVEIFYGLNLSALASTLVPVVLARMPTSFVDVLIRVVPLKDLWPKGFSHKNGIVAILCYALVFAMFLTKFYLDDIKDFRNKDRTLRTKPAAVLGLFSCFIWFLAAFAVTSPSLSSGIACFAVVIGTPALIVQSAKQLGHLSKNAINIDPKIFRWICFNLIYIVTLCAISFGNNLHYWLGLTALFVALTIDMLWSKSFDALT